MKVPIFEPSFLNSQQVEKEKVIEIVPKVEKIDQAGVMKIDFDPPFAKGYAIRKGS